MNLRQAFTSVLQLFVVFLFFAQGILFVSLPLHPQAKLKVEHFILHQFDHCFWVGGVFLGVAFLLLLSFYALSRGRYLRVQMGKHETDIDTHLIYQSVEECFKRNYPDLLSVREVEVVRGSDLEIGVRLSGDEEVLSRAEKELKTLLSQRFGYTKPFILNAKL